MPCRQHATHGRVAPRVRPATIVACAQSSRVSRCRRTCPDLCTDLSGLQTDGGLLRCLKLGRQAEGNSSAPRGSSSFTQCVFQFRSTSSEPNPAGCAGAQAAAGENAAYGRSAALVAAAAHSRAAAQPSCHVALLAAPGSTPRAPPSRCARLQTARPPAHRVAGTSKVIS